MTDFGNGFLDISKYLMEKRINKLLIISLGLAVLFGGVAFLLRNAPHTSEAGGTFDFPLCEYLSIDLQRLDVSLIPYDGEGITVEYKNDRPLDFEIGDNEFIITEDATFVVSLFEGKQAEFGIKVYLPKADYREVSVFSGTGNISVGAFDCQKLSAVTETGDINVDGAGCLLSLYTEKGNMEVDVDRIVDETEIVNRYGETKLVLPKDSSVAVDFKTLDGSCRTDIIKTEIAGSYLYAWGGGKRRINVTSEHGSVEIKEAGD